MPSRPRARSPKIKRGYSSPMKSTDYCLTYCTCLDLSDEIATLATELSKEMAQKGHYEGHRQRAMTAACIFAAAHMEHDADRLSVLRILNVVQVSQEGSFWVKDVWEFWQAHRVIWRERHHLDAVDESQMEFLLDPDDDM